MLESLPGPKSSLDDVKPGNACAWLSLRASKETSTGEYVTLWVNSPCLSQAAAWTEFELEKCQNWRKQQENVRREPCTSHIFICLEFSRLVRNVKTGKEKEIKEKKEDRWKLNQIIAALCITAKQLEKLTSSNRVKQFTTNCVWKSFSIIWNTAAFHYETPFLASDALQIDMCVCILWVLCCY